MTKHIQALAGSVNKNKPAWLMGVLNVIATFVIASGGYDLSKNTEEVSKNKETTVSMHKRMTEQQVKLAELTSQLNALKDYVDKTRTEYREDIRNLERKLNR